MSSHADADHALLFATLAARAGLISDAERDEALNRWEADRSKAIAEILVELGVLDNGARAAIEERVRSHLDGTGDASPGGLATITTVGPREGEPDDAEGTEPAQDASTPSELNGETIDPYSTRRDDPREADRSGKPPAPGPGPVPRFRVIRPHARGGLGEVHVARDEELEREVALKQIQHRYADDPGSRARFLVEARITGNLEHPGIVPVYGLGVHADGRPYYAMRFIRGETLRDAIERFHRGESRPRTPGDRAVRLRKLIVRFLAVCDAIDYAHSRGVIHRDVKPANILLGPYGETLVVDWGLAKPFGEPGPAEAADPAAESRADGAPAGRADPDATVAGPPTPTPVIAAGSGSSDQTRPGSTVGTPQYMPPEQALGALDRLGPASDVYGLGATLYALLTGAPPVDGDGPESVIARVKLGDLVPARSRDRSVDPAMEAVCSRAMAFEPGDRYPTARALADDLERWLADEPVSARREPAAARVGRWTRRHRPWVAGGVAALVVGLASLGFVSKARLDRRAAGLDRERALAEARAAGLEAEAARRAERLQHYYALVDRLRQRSAEPRPGWTWEARAELEQAAGLLAEAAPDGGADALRTIAAGLLAEFDYRVAPGLDARLNPSCLAFSPDGRTLALGEFKAQAYAKCSVVLLDARTGSVTGRFGYFPSVPFQLRTGVQDGARRIAFDPGGRWLAVGTRSGRVHCWDLSEADPAYRGWSAHEGEVSGLAFGSGGDAPVLYSSGSDGPLRRWRLDAEGRGPGDPTAILDGQGPVYDLAISPSGGLACLAGDRLLRLDPESLAVMGEAPGVSGDRLAWSPDGRILAAGGFDAITIVSAEGWRAFRRLVDPEIGAAHLGGLSGLGIHPDGAIIASCCNADADRRVKFWDASTGRLLGSYHDAAGARFGILDLAFDPEGDRLAATGRGRAAVLELSPHPAFEAVALDDGPVRALAFLPDGEGLVRLGRSDQAIRVGLWGMPGGDRAAGIDLPAGDDRGEGGVGFGLAAASGGDRIAIAGAGPEVLLWRPGSAEPPGAIAIAEAASIQFSGDGRRLWGRYDAESSIGCWDVERGAREESWNDEAAAWLRGLGTLSSLAVAEPDALVGGRDGLTRLVKIGGGGPVLARQWDHRDGPVGALAVRPGGGLAVSGTFGGSIVLLDPAEFAPIATIAAAHPGGVSRLAIAPDGRRLASGGLDRAVRLWSVEARDLRPIARIGVASGTILDLAFAPDGHSLAVAAEGEHAVRLWRLDLLADRWSSLGLGPSPLPLDPDATD